MRRPIPSPLLPSAVLGACLAVLSLLVPAAAAQAPLAQAKDVYYAGEYDRAIDLFARLARDAGAPIPERREALQYLGRAYLAQSLFDEAKRALADLLALEPPVVELNPDEEPPPLMQLYYELRKTRADGYRVERRDTTMRTLAVVDFTNSSLDDRERYDPLQRGFPSMMINYLGGATGLKVVERERLQWLLGELALQKDPSAIDQATAVRAGKLLGAHAVLIGSYAVAGGRMWVSARLASVETGEILMSEQVFGKPGDFFELIEQLSARVAARVEAKVERVQLGQRQETQSLDAMMAYSEGLALLEQRDYQAAYDKFMQALQLDPAYHRAETRAESLRPLLPLAQRGDGGTRPIKGE